MEDRFDVLVIGSGVAGALIAWRLAGAGRRVLILEAGETGPDRVELVGRYARAHAKTPGSPYLTKEGQDKAPGPDGEVDYYDQTGSPNRFKSTYQRRVGGSTWHWLGNVPRLIPSDFRMATLYGRGVDWPIGYDDLEPWYGAAEVALGVAGNHEEWDGLLGAHRSAPFPMTEIWPSHSDLTVSPFIRGLEYAGMTPAVRLRVVGTPQARNSRPYDGRPACAGSSSCIPICPIGAKYDAGVHVRKAQAAGAELREKSVVTRLGVGEDGRIATVVYRTWDEPGTERTASAAAVVLAAHAVETPRLLLHSRSARAPDGVANQSGQVGRNLMDHLTGQGAAILPMPVHPFRGPPTTSGIDTFRDGPFRREHAAFRMSLGNDGWGRAESPYDTLQTLLKEGVFGTELRARFADRVSRQFRISYSTEMLPEPHNRVELSPAPDGMGVPKPKLTMRLDDYNRAAFRIAQDVIAHIFTALGAVETRFPPDLDSYSGAGHILGTCRMGNDPAASVVNANGRAHGHPNLYIAGASVFPTGGTANPTLTVAALALRAADTIDKGLATGSFQ